MRVRATRWLSNDDHYDMNRSIFSSRAILVP